MTHIPKEFQVARRRVRGRAAECTNQYMSSAQNGRKAVLDVRSTPKGQAPRKARVNPSTQQTRSLKGEGYISLIAAASENGVIGYHNKLPWHIPAELKYFRKMTLEKPVVMGRKTFESLNKKPLPHRLNIILTHDLHFSAPDCLIVHSVNEAIEAAGDCEEIMVIGGAKIYELFLPVASRIYLSVIKGMYVGDAYFPSLDLNQWVLVFEEQMEGFSAKILERKDLLST